MNVKAKGYVLGVIAAATYGMNPLFALPLYEAGMNPDSVLFFRYLFAIPVLGMMIKLRGRDFKLKRKEIFPLIIMGLLVALSSLTLFQSYNYMAAGIASTLLFVYPIMVALIMAFLFKEKLTLQTILCIMLALGGIALLYKGEDGSVLSLTGVMLVIASALSYAIYIVAVNRPLLREIATLKLTFYVLVFGLSLFLVRVDFGASLREFNGERNHVHLLVSYPPKVSISSLVNSLKGVTSRILRNRFPELETSYCKGKLWSPSYFAASCGGAPLEKLKAYIESQNRPD